MNYFQQIFKGKTSWWRWLIIVGVFLPPFFHRFLKSYVLLPLQDFLPESKSVFVALNLSVYVIIFALFFIAFKILHKRKFLTLITKRKRFDWFRFWLSFASWGFCGTFLFSMSVFFTPDAFQWNFKLMPFLKYAIVCLLLIPFQAMVEIALLKGYLLQALGFFLKKTWLTLFTAIIVFTIIIYLNNKTMVDLVGNEIFIRFLATSILIGFIIVLDDGLEIALGMTIAHRFLAALTVTSKNFDFQPDTILIKETDINVFIVVYCYSFILYPLYFILLKKVYRWGDWKQKLSVQVEKNIS